MSSHTPNEDSGRRSPLVVVTDYIEPDLDWEAEQFAQLGVELRAHQLRHGTADELAHAARNADIVVVNMAKLDESFLRQLSRCRLIVRHGVGYDNVDVRAASALGITVTRVPDYCISEVAEQALMLVFACQRRLREQLESTRRSTSAETWDFSGIGPVHLLHGKTFGVIGCGQIGNTLLRMTEALGVRRLAVDPHIDGDSCPVEGVRMADFETLLTEADVVSVHTPLNSETRALFGSHEFTKMKPTAVLVNTSRGGIVDLAALDKALDDGQIAAAGIDVYDNEPPHASVSLLDNPKAVCTPHLGWMSQEASWRIRELIVDEVKRFISDLPPRRPIDPQ